MAKKLTIRERMEKALLEKGSKQYELKGSRWSKFDNVFHTDPEYLKRFPYIFVGNNGAVRIGLNRTTSIASPRTAEAILRLAEIGG